MPLFTCPVCRDERGWVEILPATRDAHETLARCPHDGRQLLDLKRRAEFERDTRRPHPRPGELS